MSDVVFTDFEDFVTVSGSDKSEKKDKKVFLVKILVFVLSLLPFAAPKLLFPKQSVLSVLSGLFLCNQAVHFSW